MRVGQFSPDSTQHFNTSPQNWRKIRFAPFQLHRSLLHWNTNTTQMFHSHSQHGLASKGCPAGMTWRPGEGQRDKAHHAWLTAPHPSGKSSQHTQENAMLRTESYAGKHLVHTAVIQQRWGDIWTTTKLKELWVTLEIKHGIYFHMKEERISMWF